MHKILALFLPFLLFSCASGGARAVASQDEFLWLEEVQGERALEFAKKENALTFEALKKDPRFAGLEQEIRTISLAKDRVPRVGLIGGRLYNFWQDETNVRGIWRRTTVESYRTAQPAWETVLDLDQLAKDEGENWVWKGVECLAPASELCLIRISRAGKDASVVREFNAVTKTFVKDGFFVPESKGEMTWINQNEVFVTSDFGDGSLTDAGYPRIVKRWKRGEPLAAAKEIFAGEKTDIVSSGFTSFRPEGNESFVFRMISRFESELFWVSPKGELVRTPLPRSAKFQTFFRGGLLYQLRQDLNVGRRTYVAGSLLSLPLRSLAKAEAALGELETVFTPTSTRFLSDVATTRSYVLLNVMDTVKGKVLRWKPGSSRAEPLSIGGKNGVATATSTEEDSDSFLASYTDFLTPPSTYYVGKNVSLLKTAPARFDASGLVSEQKWAVSKDGTKIPYFIVHKKALKRDGRNSTLLYGYGGFETSLLPFYSGIIGKAWLERGGVFVLANIRGGGEFGPRWNQAALKENRQRAFDDFIAVGEDLVRSKITSARHLGIQGGSNGGLLVGAVFVQRPDLFNAVLCEVPLLDMLRFHKLLAGASWVGEYGSPEVPAEREALARYSPFQNVTAGKKYPEAFFLTSTADDRVHPGHARRMVARMREQGNPLFYYENTEGGHGGSANIEQSILWSALEYTYLWRKLGNP